MRTGWEGKHLPLSPVFILHGQARGARGLPCPMKQCHGSQNSRWKCLGTAHSPSVRNPSGLGSTAPAALGWGGIAGMSRTRSQPQQDSNTNSDPRFPSPCPFHTPSGARNSFSTKPSTEPKPPPQQQLPGTASPIIPGVIQTHPLVWDHQWTLG